MYPTPEENAAVQAAEKLMTETMAKYDPSHDAFHVQRVRKTALAIARAVSASSSQKPDLLTVEFAALLHDVLDKKYVTAEQAADPYAFFLPFFHTLPVDIVADGRAKEIAKIVDNVSWSTEKKLRSKGEWGPWHEACVELHCVQDADRLDAIGAFGVMRCAAYNATKNNALYAPPGHPLEAASSIQHFHDKLVHVHDRLKTEPGRKLGEKRHRLLVDFIASVEEEYNAEV